MAIRGKAHRRASAFTYVALDRVQVPAAVEFTFTGEPGEPDVFGRFEIRAGRPECVEIRITARPNGRDLRTADLQGITEVGVDALTSEAFERFAVEPNADGSWTWEANELDADGRPRAKAAWDIQADRDLAWLAAGELRERRQSRRPVSQEELEVVAGIYREHVDGNPTAKVQKVFGYSKRTAFRRVEQARAAGLLPRLPRKAEGMR